LDSGLPTDGIKHFKLFCLWSIVHYTFLFYIICSK